jgi:hypothetical protein
VIYDDRTVGTSVCSGSDLEDPVVDAEDEQRKSQQGEKSAEKNASKPFPERRDWGRCHEVQIISPEAASDAR